MVKSASLLIVALALLSCKGEEGTDSETSAIVLKGARWANPGAIPVCWDNGSQVDAEILSDVKNKILAEYHGKTKLRFVGFQNCTAADATKTMIRVHFKFTHDWSSGNSITAGAGQSWLGPNAQALPNQTGKGTMFLEIGKGGKYPPPGNVFRNFVVNATRSTAVHEFGHAVGLAHEHQRSDGPKCSDQMKIPNSGSYVYVGAYDPNSIMNYCKKDNIDSLSSGDVEGIKFLYPTGSTTPIPVPPPITTPVPTQPTPDGSVFNLVARHSKACVDISGANKANGSKVQQYQCNQTTAQAFRLVASAGNTFLIKNVNSGRCLDVMDRSTSAGAIQQWDCHGGTNQRVVFRPTSGGFNRIQFIHSNLCIDVDNASLSNETRIIQYACHADGQHQEFSLVKVQ